MIKLANTILYVKYQEDNC